MGKTVHRNHRNESHRQEPYKKEKYNYLRNVRTEDFDEEYDDDFDFDVTTDE